MVRNLFTSSSARALLKGKSLINTNYCTLQDLFLLFNAYQSNLPCSEGTGEKVAALGGP